MGSYHGHEMYLGANIAIFINKIWQIPFFLLILHSGNNIGVFYYNQIYISMGFLSNLFSSKKKTKSEDVIHNVPDTNQSEIANISQIENCTSIQTAEEDSCEIKEDENGWRFLSNGIKIKNDSMIKGTIGEIKIKCISELGYNLGELYSQVDYTNSQLIIGFFQLLTNKLVGIFRNDDIIMSLSEIDSYAKEHGSILEYEEENIIKDGIANNSISQSYIETVCEKKCENSQLSNGKFLFTFDNGYLLDYQRIDDYSADARDFLDVDSYYEEAKEWYRGNKNAIASEINLQASCLTCTDLNIIKSYETKKRFSYQNGYPNYIAIATYYKSKDITLEDFINSTHGEYEIVAKDIQGGVITTKVKAYGVLITFIDGHSIVDLNIDCNNDEENSNNGYVYVMINPSFPNMVKIGKTTKDPNERAKELSAATGVPTPFMVVFYKPFFDCDLAEKTIHEYLEEEGYRVNDNREFFSMTANEAINVVQAYYDVEQKNNSNAF